MSQGWIKLHRKIWKNPVVTKDTDHFTLWIYLLTHATHQDHDTLWQGKKITLHAGQLITGRKKLSTETGIEQSKVVRILNHFKTEHQIEQQTNSRGTLISIVAWDKYQIIEQPIEQQVNNKRTTSEQQLNTKQEYKEQKEQRDIHITSNADKVGLSVKDYIRLKAKGEIE